jgi:RHS repeat-associated protein
VFLNLPDRLGSTAFVIDMGTSEVVERTTHQAYGALDADFRGISPGSSTSPRWHGFREDHKFTGQWDDAEVGVVYMNARYYSPALGRFISPDPTAIHDATGDLNPYAYAVSSPLAYTDPLGLSPITASSANCVDSSCAEPQFSPGDSSDVVSDQQMSLLVLQSQVLTQQQIDLGELLQPAQVNGELQVFAAAAAVAGLAGGGAGVAAAGPVLGGGSAVGALVGTDLVTDAALLRAGGGAVSGGLSAIIQGKDAAGVAQAAAVNGLVSLWNPGALVGGRIVGATVNSLVSNSENQLLSIAINGQSLQSFNFNSLLVSGTTRFLFGAAAYGPGTDVTLSPGGVFVYQTGAGLAGGAASGAANVFQLRW